MSDSAPEDVRALPALPRVRGAVARSTTWWGRAFVRSFEEVALDVEDLRPARTLSRSGRFGSIVVLPAMASAVLDPRAESPLLVQVRVTPLPDTDWEVLTREAARESGYLAALEDASLSAEWIEHADEAGAELIPGAGEFETACECEAWAPPCRHALALLYQVAHHLDADPYVLMLLRGRPREALLDEITAHVVTGSSRDAADPDESLDRAVDPASAAMADRGDVSERARAILALASDPPGASPGAPTDPSGGDSPGAPPGASPGDPPGASGGPPSPPGQSRPRPPRGAGLADADLAAYDEAVHRLLSET